MPAILRFLRSRWVLSLLGVVLLGVLVWLFGPFLPALEGWIARGVVILALLLVWAGVNAWLDHRRRRADTALMKGVAAPDPALAATAEETAAMREKLAGAMALLKRASGQRGYLYEQPWYIIIGPPGAGKTTALLNAGLKFPLAAELGQSPVPGVGGTRMCDWWFTDQAVLIDTAGRYTTQDSDAAVDKAGWTAFLALLKRTRARQPLNGLLVAISLADIAAAPASERTAHARAIRRRVKEVYDQLGTRVPVYAMFTKADLLAGFIEFFDDLDRERRAQVWGTTFPLGGPVSASGVFQPEFALLVERLNARLLERLQAERSPERRALIAGFPVQVASLQAPLGEFLGEAFDGSRLDPGPLLRGVYFTSGTQEGTPIDRLTGTLSRLFGVDQQRAPSLRPEQGRSYFLGRLLSDVIFGEAMLVARNPVAVRRAAAMRVGAVALAGLVLLLGAGALWQTRQVNQDAVARADAATASYARNASAQTLDPVADADFARVAPLLDQARALPFGAGAPAPTRQWFPGLSQIGKLRAGAGEAYRHALDDILLPRMVRRLEQQVRASFENPALLYDATRVYLMLGTDGPMDRASVRAWMHYDWANTYPGPAAQPLRDSLDAHLAALLDNPLPKVPLDGGLVDEARRIIARVPLAQRVYATIRRSPAAQALPAWNPASAAGAAGARLFLRKSGKPITDPIPGFFTLVGFHDVLLPMLPAATAAVASESWVLGRQSQIDPASPQVASLEQDVVALYAADYERQWDALLADLEVAPMQTPEQAVQDLYLLSSPRSPMKDLLMGIARQLTLSKPPAPPAGAPQAVQAAAKAATAVGQAASGAAARVEALLGQGGGTQAAPPGSAVDEHYAALRTFAGDGTAPAPIDAVLKLLGDLQQQLAQVATAAPGGGAPPVTGGNDPAGLLRAEASRDPQPVARWLDQLSGGANTIRGSGAHEQAAAAFNGPGGPGSLCHKAVDNRYPFFPGSAQDIPLADFARLFAPGGLLDAYFNTQLRPFVDTTGAQWKAQAVQGVAPPVSAAALAQFQRAAAIRNSFFAAGGTQPSVQFEITPASLDNAVLQVTLQLGDRSISYAHGPPRPTEITWPGPAGMSVARLVFDPAPANGSGVVQATGPWAVFRLFDRGSLRQEGSADRYSLSFSVGGHEAAFDVRAASVLTPLSPSLLRGFRCPGL